MKRDNLSYYMPYVAKEHAHILTEEFLRECRALATELDRVNDLRMKTWGRFEHKVLALDTYRATRDAHHQVNVITRGNRRPFGIEWATVLSRFYKEPESNEPYDFTTYVPTSTPLKLSPSLIAKIEAFADALTAVEKRRDELWATISEYVDGLETKETVAKLHKDISYACFSMKGEYQGGCCFPVELACVYTKLHEGKK